jgi:hypothetical protein
MKPYIWLLNQDLMRKSWNEFTNNIVFNKIMVNNAVSKYMTFMYDNYPQHFTSTIKYYNDENVCYDEAELYYDLAKKNNVDSIDKHIIKVKQKKLIKKDNANSVNKSIIKNLTKEDTNNLDEIIDNYQKCIVDLFVSNKNHGCCMIASILFKELLAKYDISSDIVEGWWFSTKFTGRHYWVEIDKRIYDIGSIILKKLVPQFPDIYVSHNMQTNLQRIDNKTIKEKYDLSEMEIGYTLYKEKNLKYIKKNAPAFIKKFIIINNL